MKALLMLIMLAVSGAMIGGLAWWTRTVRNRREAIWRQVAETHGARFQEPIRSWLRPKPAAIEAVIGQAIVFLDTYVVSTGKSSATFTRARASFALGGGPSFKVYREGVLSSIGKAIGTQDVELGDDRGFDDAFMVKCDDAPATRQAWSPKAKGVMFGQLDDVRVVSDGDEVVLTGLGALTDPSKLSAMLELAGELASYGARELSVYEQLPGARSRLVDLDGPKRYELEVDTKVGSVHLTLEAPGPLGLVLTLAHDRELPSFSADVTPSGGTGLPTGLVTDVSRALLLAVGRAKLDCGPESLCLSWPGQPSVATATAGVKLLAELAGGVPSEGAFR